MRTAWTTSVSANIDASKPTWSRYPWTPSYIARSGRAESALDDDGAGDEPRRSGMAPARLDDAGRVATERGRQHLTGGVADEVRARQPAEPVVDATHGEQPLPTPRDREHRADGDH